MRDRVMSVGLVAASMILLGCGSDQGTNVTATGIRLTAAQAAALMSRVTQIAPVHPELAWLADSARLVLKSGAEADVIELTTDLAPGPFYAVGLQRSIVTSSNSFATFDLIAFNDPSNPTAFIIVDGYAPGSQTTPPSSITGEFGGGAVSGYLFQVIGGAVSAWRAAAGIATLATGSVGNACLDFQPGAGVTCEQSDLHAQLTIGVAQHDNGVQPSDTRSASLSPTSVAGILLHFHS
jgi:hypothetical protein